MEAEWVFVLRDKGAEVDGEAGPDSSVLFCSDVDRNELKRVDEEYVGTLEAEDEELVVDTPVVVDSGWSVDVEDSATEVEGGDPRFWLVPVNDDEAFVVEAEQSFAGKFVQSFVERVDESLEGPDDESFAAAVEESFIDALQSFQTMVESFAEKVQSFQTPEESLGGTLEYFTGAVLASLDAVVVEVHVKEDFVMV